MQYIKFYKEYIENINKKHALSQATGHIYISCVEEFFKKRFLACSIINEPQRIKEVMSTLKELELPY